LSSSSDENPSASIQKERSPASDISKKFPPPYPLPPKSLMQSNEPVKIGGNIAFLYVIYTSFLSKLQKFAGHEEAKQVEAPYSPAIPESPSSSGGLSPEAAARTLKSVITNEVAPQEVIYERLFGKSLPQQKRESYFLTEMYNIKSLIRRRESTEESIDLRLRTSLLKDTSSSSQSLSPYYIPTSPEDTTLVFESRFESGNLCLATKVCRLSEHT